MYGRSIKWIVHMLILTNGSLGVLPLISQHTIAINPDA